MRNEEEKDKTVSTMQCLGKYDTCAFKNSWGIQLQWLLKWKRDRYRGIFQGSTENSSMVMNWKMMKLKEK